MRALAILLAAALALSAGARAQQAPRVPPTVEPEDGNGDPVPVPVGVPIGKCTPGHAGATYYAGAPPNSDVYADSYLVPAGHTGVLVCGKSGTFSFLLDPAQQAVLDAQAAAGSK